MRPQNYQPEIPAVKPVRMKLFDCHDCLTLTAVDENNEQIADIFRFYEHETVSAPGAKDRLEARGYDTSFAEWNEHGGIIVKQLKK